MGRMSNPDDVALHRRSFSPTAANVAAGANSARPRFVCGHEPTVAADAIAVSEAADRVGSARETPLVNVTLIVRSTPYA